MAINYTSLQTTAKNLLANAGQSITFSRTTGATFDPVTGTETGGTTTTITGNGVALNYSKDEIDGQSVQRDDIKIIFEATQGVPLIGDTVTVNSVDHQAISVSPLSPAGIDVIYYVQVRK